MSSTNTGGPAFPSTYTHEDGMTLRDYFAAKAMAGILAKEGSTTDLAFGAYAEYAYQVADAMLKAREAK